MEQILITESIALLSDSLTPTICCHGYQWDTQISTVCSNVGEFDTFIIDSSNCFFPIAPLHYTDNLTKNMTANFLKIRGIHS